MTSYKHMCETIAVAEIMQNKDGTLMTAEEIFNYSATGELFSVHIWYLMSLQKTGKLRDEIKKTAHLDKSINCFIADQDTYAGDYLFISESGSIAIAGSNAAKGHIVFIGTRYAL